ncbi:LysR family transcriptional regulator [Enterobacteriaceae bacterium 89]|nr:LysR family transcriptional regulator [Enterobacteriaceae bacterium 89]
MKKEIDLKLLKVIHAIVTSGTVTEAARKLQQSPGNISYQLGKIREITGGHLFIRTREGMKPDATALELSQRYQQFIDGTTLSDRDQKQKRNSLNINTWSLVEMLLAGSVFCEQGHHPVCRFVFNSYIANPEERLFKLKNRQIDIDIGNKLPADSQISAVKLFTSDVSVLVGKKFRQQDTPFSLQELKSSRYVVWSANPDFYSDNIDGAVQIAQLRATRDVAVVSASMINMVSLCANSHYIMLIPDFFVPMLEKSFPVKCLSLPEECALRYDCYLHYHTQLGSELLALATVRDALTRMTKPSAEAMLSVSQVKGDWR